MDYLTEFKKEGFDQQKLFRISTRAERRMCGLAFTRDLVVSDVGYYPRASQHRVERNTGLKSHILVFCLSGRGWFKWGKQRRYIVPMEMFWIPAKAAHAYGSHSSDPWEIFWVHAYGVLVEDLLTWSSLSNSRPKASFANPQALKRQFNALFQRLELGYTDHTLLELSRFFVTLTNLLHADSGSEREIIQKENIERAMDRMRQTLSQPLSLTEYARDAGLSVSQFSHLFKRHYGASPMAYFTELRMQRAKDLLNNTHLSIKEVSWELGFDDPLYFSRLFKKVTSIAPSQFRSE